MCEVCYDSQLTSVLKPKAPSLVPRPHPAFRYLQYSLQLAGTLTYKVAATGYHVSMIATVTTVQLRHAKRNRADACILHLYLGTIFSPCLPLGVGSTAGQSCTICIYIYACGFSHVSDVRIERMVLNCVWVQRDSE